jgi:hypothetical protein
MKEDNYNHCFECPIQCLCKAYEYLTAGQVGQKPVTQCIHSDKREPIGYKNMFVTCNFTTNPATEYY